MFGDIIYENINNNLKNTKICECCKERFEVTSNKDVKSKLCEECKKIYVKEYEKLKKRKQRKMD